MSDETKSKLIRIVNTLNTIDIHGKQNAGLMFTVIDELEKLINEEADAK